MGAWGHGSFENDSALDWFAELQEGGAEALGDALDAAAADDETYLEVDECSAALAAAELVAAAAGGGDERLSDDARAWLGAHRADAQNIGKPRALAAVARVLRKSELRELWDENGADTEWHRDVAELARRLSA